MAGCELLPALVPGHRKKVIQKTIVFALGPAAAALRRGELEIILRAHVRHFPNERHEIPDVGIVQRFSPRGHRAHLDTVLDDPERSPSVLYLFLGEIRRMRVQPYADRRLALPRGQMTSHA